MQHFSPGDKIGDKYRIVRLIGDGGMGSVYEAQHEVLKTSVALKFLHPNLAKNAALAERFLQEARVSATIQSPHVIRVTDVDRLADGGPYLVMEYLVGESLQAMLDRSTSLPRDLAVDLTLQILLGLEAAHAIGVIHRDLKPDNVFVTQTEAGPVIKLLDFGIAKLRNTTEFKKNLTRPGAVMGTPEYMPPEQAFSSDSVDVRSDLYSVGAMLYEMLSGRLPAEGDNAQIIAQQVITGNVRPLMDLNPALPRSLASAVHTAIDRDPGNRYQTARQMRVALAGLAGQLSQAGRLAATFRPDSIGPPMTAAGTQEVPSQMMTSQQSYAAQVAAANASPSGAPAARISGAPGQPVTTQVDTTPGSPAGGGQRQITAAMEALPQMNAGGSAPPGAYAAPPATLAGGSPLAHPVAKTLDQRPTRSHAALWWGLALLLLIGGGAVAAWAYYNQSSPIPPPLPTPQNTADTGPVISGPTSIDDDDLEDGTRRQQQRGSSTPPRSAGNPTTASGGQAGLQIPPLALPSTLPPLPSGLPNLIPSQLPQIPGLPPLAPGNTAGASNAAPAASTP